MEAFSVTVIFFDLYMRLVRNFGVRLQTLSYSWWSQVYVDLHKLGWSLGGISKQLQTPRSSVQRIVVIHVVIQTCHHFSKVWKKTPTLTLGKEEIG